MADEIDTSSLRNGVVHRDERTGELKMAYPAGGSGGGTTGFVERPLTDAEHLAFLKKESDLKKAESDDFLRQHEEASKKIAERKAEEEKNKKPDPSKPVSPSAPVQTARPPVTPLPVTPR